MPTNIICIYRQEVNHKIKQAQLKLKGRRIKLQKSYKNKKLIITKKEIQKE